MAFSDPLVSADWLKQTHGAANVKIVDATWVPPFLHDPKPGPDRYKDAHIPGAIYFDIDAIADKSSSLSHMLPPPNQFEAQISALGISNADHVIAYDSNGFFASARAWWMFRAMGHKQVQVLNGGLNAWRAVDGALDSEVTELAPSLFKATFKAELVRNMDAMRRHVASGDTQVLDARTDGRFNGTDPEPRPELPSGHMPGSFCIPVPTLMAEHGRMRSADVLAASLNAFLDQPVVTTCGSGVSAAVIALALARAGNWDAAIYDGSWSEWASNVDNPIATRA